jgi:glutaminyl-peptide cyclotransferase
MKNSLYTLFIISLLSIQCGKNNSTNNSFSIDSKSLKASYFPADTLNLSVLNANNVEIDSVVYFVNDKKIEKKTTLSFHITFSEFRLGYHNIKAIIYSEGTTQTTETRVEVVSPIVPKLINYTLVNTYPHDKEAYTQGLEFYRDTLLESTGQYGRSSLRKTDFKTGNVFQNFIWKTLFLVKELPFLTIKLYS